MILKSTQNKTNHFEMIMKSLYGLCISKLQPIDKEKIIKARNRL